MPAGKPPKPPRWPFVLRRLNLRQLKRIAELEKRSKDREAKELRRRISNARIKRFEEIAEADPARGRWLATSLFENAIPINSTFDTRHFSEIIKIERPLLNEARYFLEREYTPSTIPQLDRILKRISDLRKSIERRIETARANLEKPDITDITRQTLLAEVSIPVSMTKDTIRKRISAAAKLEETQF